MTAKAREPRQFPLAPPPIPPRPWPRRERVLWNRIIESYPEGYFRASDSEDLVVYVRAALELEELEAVIAQECCVLVDSKTGRRYPHPACVLRDRAWVRLASAGVKLRIHLSSRVRAEDAHTASKLPSAARLKPWETSGDDGRGAPKGKRRNGKDTSVYFDA